MKIQNMFNRTRHYFISYYFINENKSGFGQVDIETQKIKNNEMLENVRRYIEKEYHIEQVVIVNWKEYK